MNNISIIIPIYNSSEYLDKCILSVLNQSYRNFELILINDGSTDNSLEICKKYLNIDTRIHILNIKNSGVSVARNKGIMVAKNEYVMFIDSDDYIASDALEILWNEARISPDLVIGKTNIVRNHKENELKINNEIIEGRNRINSLFYPYFDNLIVHTPCGKLYKKKVLVNNNILFDSNFSLGEDLLFNVQFLNSIELVSMVNETVYFYVKKQNSLTTKYRINYFNIRLNLINKIKNYYKMNQFDMNNIYYQIMKASFSSFMMFHHKENKNKIKKTLFEINEIKKTLFEINEIKNNFYVIDSIKKFKPNNFFQIFLKLIFLLNNNIIFYYSSYFAVLFKNSKMKFN